MNALDEPSFNAPLLRSMEGLLPALPLLKYFSPLRFIALNMPPWLGPWINPQMAGLGHLLSVRVYLLPIGLIRGALTTPQMLDAQVTGILKNPEVLQDTRHPTIFHRLFDPTSYKGQPFPGYRGLFDEANALLVAGTDTVANALMFGRSKRRF